jgi:hypothetical protein
MCLNTRMRIGEISESVTDDVNAYTKASEIALAVMKRLCKGDYDFEIDAGDDGNFFGLSGKVFPKPFDDVLFMFGRRKPDVRGIAGAYHDKVSVEGHNHLIVVYGLREGDELPSLNSPSVLEVLIHEIIHLLDGLRTDGSIFKPYNPRDRVTYFNDPAEFNAFFMELASNLLSFIQEARRYPDNSLEGYADIFGIDVSFKRTLARQMSGESMREFLKNLTEPRHKAAMRRLYKLHQEAMRLLQR